jgi:3-oxoadipate enol-lactonase/4-carboxymuconolactone decarboxylase
MFVDIAGSTVHVQIDGDAGRPALVLLHSLGTCLQVWDPQAAALARDFRVIRPDLRGHGLTGLGAGEAGIEGMAADVLAVLDALGVAQAHLGGLSIGGLVAQALALAAPARVLSLMLCDTAMVFPPAQMWRDRAEVARSQGLGVLEEGVLARWVTPAGLDTPAARGLRAMLRRTPAEGYAAAADALGACDLSARTGSLGMPTLILVGDQDQATPRAAAEALHAAIAGSALVVLEGAAHIPTLECARAVTAAMQAFLRQVCAAEEPADFHAAGMAVRRQVLGEAHVARAVAATTEFDRVFQAFITRTAWGGVWARPELDRRTRSLLTLVLLAGLGREEEFRLHIRASRHTGATPADIAAALLHVAVYAGIPAANTAMRIAKEMFAEMETQP